MSGSHESHTFIEGLQLHMLQQQKLAPEQVWINVSVQEQKSA